MDVADALSTGEFAPLGDLRLVNEKDGTGAFDALGDFSFGADVP